METTHRYEGELSVAYLLEGPGPKKQTEPGHCGRICDEAHRLFCLFHRFPAPRVARLRCRRVIPKVLVHLGDLRALIYSSDKGAHGCARTYIHFMERPPRLACDPQGTQLYIVGGRYQVTPRGIEG